MELIDKNQILYMIDNINRVVALKNEIDDIPIIEAIPIDFLIKTQEEYCKRYGEVYKAVVLNLLEDWRKENETNNI